MLFDNVSTFDAWLAEIAELRQRPPVVGETLFGLDGLPAALFKQVDDWRPLKLSCVAFVDDRVGVKPRWVLRPVGTGERGLRCIIMKKASERLLGGGTCPVAVSGVRVVIAEETKLLCEVIL